MRRILFMVLLLTALSACQKEEVVSLGQQTATRIQTDNKTAGARVALVYIGLTPVTSGAFGLDGDYITVETTRYNLNRLISYRIGNSAGVQTLFLYF
ncbi:hypothetical protein [Fibrella forsythiae]|uniref:Uncharacterized protein n=1 Tax=Fibrella forsythiae TaxID=2817061 RepID=A0ABS3JTD4_9BACT|nr:hypothetical protein [Fibrella forsythiae]MBO0953272.1 hypothetical protein [Fibrella forsythiae]